MRPPLTAHTTPSKGVTPPSTHRPDGHQDPEALIKEARRRARIRRLGVVGVVILILAGTGLGYAVAQRGPISRSTAAQRPKPAIAAASTTGLAATCPGGMHVGTLEQAMDGAITGCIRVGMLGPGSYHVLVNAGFIPMKGRVATKASGTAAPRVKVTISPTSGPPGTLVTLRGITSEPVSQEPGHINLCWDGCRHGLVYSGVSAKWSSPTTFVTHLVVPAAPWVEYGPDRILQPVSGPFPIGVQCVTPFESGCAGDPAQGAAMFNISGKALSWCRTISSCATLTASPHAALPGEPVEVSGFAPLVSVIGSQLPFLFQIEVHQGSYHGNEVVFAKPASLGNAPASKKARLISTRDVLLGHASLKVTAAPSFASLGKLNVIRESSDALSSWISANPEQPERVGYCAAGHIAISSPSGITEMPTAGVPSAIGAKGLYAYPSNEPPRCVSLALPAGDPSAVLASFAVNPHNQAPPLAYVALVTTDSGKTWSMVPTPPGASPDSFGGFRYNGTSIEALFSQSGSGHLNPQAYSGGTGPLTSTPLVEITNNAGESWSVAHLACPKSGPCVAFGPGHWGNCAMNGVAQTLLRSNDGGARWSSPVWPVEVQACAPAQLVAVSHSTELLVDSGSPYLLFRSTDSGLKWQVIALPKISGLEPDQGFGSAGNGLVMIPLPAGGLLATGTADQAPPASWSLLKAGSHSWCHIAKIPAKASDVPVISAPVVIGHTLWWMGDPQHSITSATLYHIEVADLTC